MTDALIDAPPTSPSSLSIGAPLTGLFPSTTDDLLDALPTGPFSSMTWTDALSNGPSSPMADALLDAPPTGPASLMTDGLLDVTGVSFLDTLPTGPPSLSMALAPPILGALLTGLSSSYSFLSQKLGTQRGKKKGRLCHQPRSSAKILIL